MTPSQQLARARTCVQICFADGQVEEDPTENHRTAEVHEIEFRESIFICEGFYRGRRFRTASMTAVWFAEEDQLKIHSVEGKLIASFDADEMTELITQQETRVIPMRPLSVTSDQPSTDTGEVKTDDANPVLPQPARRAA